MGGTILVQFGFAKEVFSWWRCDSLLTEDDPLIKRGNRGRNDSCGKARRAEEPDVKSGKAWGGDRIYPRYDKAR